MASLAATSDATVRRRGKRLGHRVLQRARVTLGAAVDAAQVQLLRGAHKVTTDNIGALVSATYEPSGRAWIEIGERLVVTAVSLDDDRIGVAEVEHIHADGSTLDVRRTCGEIPEGDSFIMRGPKPRDTRPVIRRAVVREAERPGQALADLVRAKRLEITGGVE